MSQRSWTLSGLAAILLPLVLWALPVTPRPAQAQTTAGGSMCQRIVFADVVALDQPFYLNRMGAIVANGMIYALRRDVVQADTGKTEAEGGSLTAGNVALRPDKRPRPLTLRANVGDCLKIRFTNLLDPNTFIFSLPPEFPIGPLAGTQGSINQQVDDQPITRAASIHIDGLHLVGSIGSDGSFVGKNPSSLVEPGQSATYIYHAGMNGTKQGEQTHLMYSMGATVGAEGGGGTRAFGLFGAVNVEPTGAEWYRSQLTRAEIDLATTGLTPDGQPMINYGATYPAGSSLGKGGLPILSMLAPCATQACQEAGGSAELVHGDLNAIITGAGRGGFGGWYEPNPAYPGRDRPFREFTVIFQDEMAVVQAFPSFYRDPVLGHTLHGVRDSFGINYGTGGIGSEIIGNRLGVGPMWDCTECKYEEFFLTSWAVGDPSMVVDVPANFDDPGTAGFDTGPKATKALYPDDPSNVHHSYLNDRVIYRNLHAGPKEHHIFHLHAHQWLWSPNDPQSNYLDSQTIGPGSGYTYEIAYGGSGNRNKTAGDSIFHCHFYPHFAQGMWEMWRVHDVFERGTELDAGGAPVAGARALPDPEITAGTPIPALVPLPGQPMAPMPDGAAGLATYDLNGDGVADSSQFDTDGNGVADVAEGWSQPVGGNPGYPFFIPGMVGHRPPTPALDLIDDGGLPRHVVVSGPNAAIAGYGPGLNVEQYQTRLDFNKIVHAARAVQVPEEGTPAERAAMDFHYNGGAPHATYKPDGSGAAFTINGLPPARGAPFADPCRADNGGPVSDTDGDGAPNIGRTYKGANIQTSVTLNKVGWHFQQQRFEALWDDVLPLLNRSKAPEPLVMRLNSHDCVEFWHTNLVPSVYELDDFQVRTPTDIIGQHIHLVKFDVTSADGSANGWNYEDGTLSPDEVRERIEAFNHAGFKGLDGNVRALAPQPHPFFGATGPGGQNWLGARTTVQRWYADPLLARSWDNGVGTVFTHDHYGPSTHQQVGLYSTVLVEPESSTWRDPESGVIMGTRHDGGPTSWRADILLPGANAPYSHREFYFEFADFQHAYEAGKGRLTTTGNGAGKNIPSYADFFNSIAPSYRQQPPAGRERDIYWTPNNCPGGVPRPCPEAISADDPGTYVVNYRNEPIGLRVFNGQVGAGAGQAQGQAGDLARAFMSRTDRAIPALNTQPGTYPPLTKDVRPGDPWTPMMRAYMGDRVRIRVQVGAHEEEHSFTIHGIKWKHENNSPNSGWGNSLEVGISEFAIIDTPVLPDIGLPGNPASVDYMYTMGAEVEDLWNGIWGIFRAYRTGRNDLLPLPNNAVATASGPKYPENGYKITNEKYFDDICPIDNPNTPANEKAPVRSYRVTAVRAADVLGPQGLVYNSRATTVAGPFGGVQGSGPLHDPNALMYLYTDDLIFNSAGKPIGLKPGTPIEPLVLRAAAGDCIKVEVSNALPTRVPDQPGLSALPPVIAKHKNVLNGGVRGITSFNNNDLTPSSMVGLHPQLVAYNLRSSDGFAAGQNRAQQLVQPGSKETYVWYAGDIDFVNNGNGTLTLIPTPIEFGVVNLMPADRIKGSNKGLIGALVIEAQGATWREDPGSRVSATVTRPGGQRHREFVVIQQDDVNFRYSGGCDDPFLKALDCAVAAFVAEGNIPEDYQDSGNKAINYRSDPLWYRLGIAPNTPFEEVSRDPALKDPIAQVFANCLIGGNCADNSGGEDPQAPVFVASPASGIDEVRMLVVQPGGHARGHVFTVHGQSWARLPFTNDSTKIGYNPLSQYYGIQEGVSPAAHWNLVLNAGGPENVVGDYLFRDQSSFGSATGLWGLMRFNTSAPMAGPDAYVAVSGQATSVAAPGLLRNDLDLDGNGLRVEIVGQPANGSLSAGPDGSFTYTSRAGFLGSDSFTYKVCETGTDLGLCSGPTTATLAVVDKVTVRTAVFTRNTERWSISGTALPTGAPAQRVTIYRSRDNKVIGTATVGVGGAWSFSGEGREDRNARAGDTVYAISTAGGSSTPLTVTIR